MNLVLHAAMFIVLWWIVLFAVLPFGLKTQDDEQDVTLGTVASAPGKSRHVAMAMLWTTLISVGIFGGVYLISSIFGLSVDDIPRFVPDFD